MAAVATATATATTTTAATASATAPTADLDDPSSSPVVIRRAVVADCVQLEANLRAINEFERQDMTKPQVTVSDLERDGFGAQPAFWAFVADCGGQLVGHAIYTRGWAGYDGIGRYLYLTDLFVREQARRRGVGRRLVQAVAAVAVEDGAPHIEFTVYGWNEPALAFYRSLGCRSATDERRLLSYYCERQAVCQLASAHAAGEGEGRRRDAGEEEGRRRDGENGAR